jgi:hypothetical protein
VRKRLVRLGEQATLSLLRNISHYAMMEGAEEEEEEEEEAFVFEIPRKGPNLLKDMCVVCDKQDICLLENVQLWHAHILLLCNEVV